MPSDPRDPRVVLFCHDDDVIDREGLTAWLATGFRLTGVIVIHDTLARRYRAARREWRRSGALGFLDAVAFRGFYAIAIRSRDRRWMAAETDRLRRRYAAESGAVPTLAVSDPNGEAVRQFLERMAPDLVVARCKVLLRPGIFRIPAAGTWVLHPGICPEYRNAHGCFWALVRRDLSRVGMTLLRIDAGVDTGPVFLHATCPVDERHESHVVIQYRVVTENLDRVTGVLRAACADAAATADAASKAGAPEGARADSPIAPFAPRLATSIRPIDTSARPSAAWGQPRLSAYWRWKRAAARNSASESARASGVGQWGPTGEPR